MDDDLDVDEVLEAVGFDSDDGVLTRRQAEVLVLRGAGLTQATVADRLGTSRANVSAIETSARENVRKARETVSVASILDAAVRIAVPAGTDLFEIPDRVYDTCDEVGIDVGASSAAIVRQVTDTVDGSIDDQTVRDPLLIGVDESGALSVRRLP